MPDHDVVIIGAGIAGLSAATFSARLGMDTVVLERLMPGGQIINAEIIEDIVGLRPGRTEVRLEKELISGKTVIHNYGHGGSGVTLSWGCAEEVVEIANE